ncbi:Protoporphyrinogen IX oxidase, novel form, HemJ [hydrothermal vent metagenome]|uniref:Protoporphyrinogen IX oxidase, novel form, HemJ n=1 Tax=hydrothermal vent metagenome TaxID=652676 RepID=A0A1W1CQJ8_9ZZZZ
MLWIKSFHIITVVTWFAALFYLPRLFVYHAMCQDKISLERFKVMERKLYYGIMMPSMVLTLVFGFVLLFSYGFHYFANAYWLHLKLLLVALLVGYHFYCGYLVSVFKNDINNKSDRFYRVLNELPVIVLIAIVILVVVKPI